MPEFIVEGIIPRRGVTLLTGEGGIGKSFLLVELAYSVAAGQPFLGRFSSIQGLVLFIDLENDEATIAHRVRKITAAHLESTQDRTSVSSSPPGQPGPHSSSLNSDLPVHFLKKHDLASASLYINEDHGRSLFIRILNRYKPMLVLIDPLTGIHSADENDNVTMRRMIAFLQKVARTQWRCGGCASSQKAGDHQRPGTDDSRGQRPSECGRFTSLPSPDKQESDPDASAA